jgi:hypothetical protein
MGRVYTASFAGLAITAQVDFIEILCGSADVILVHEIGISQLLDVGDASAEHLLLKYRQGLTGAGTAGTAQTPEPRQTGDPASDATVTTGRTTKGTGGNDMERWAWNVLLPFQHIWTPETRPVLSPSQRDAIELATTPNDSITCSGYITFEELG